MKDKYKISVNNLNIFEFTADDLSQLDIVPVGENGFHVLSDNKPFQTEVISFDFLQKKCQVKINNNLYWVSISGKLENLINEMGISAGSTKQINSIKAPMPGLIIEVSVQAGQEVKENDQLLILEAMKMENSILSPRDGVIKSITVAKSHAVDKGQLLIEFE
jgi:biotin carboxyl carrier protein